MNEPDQDRGSKSRKEPQWYGLFSRGARDWLRHNEKVRDAVKQHLPELVADLDILGGGSNRTVRVPVRFLEHYRFMLRKDEESEGIGQGDAEPGNVIHRQKQTGEEGEKGDGSDSGEGAPEFLLEFKVDDIVDWFWEELNLPDLQAKSGSVEDDEYIREGWDKRGARARLDRRRTLKEAIKRRAAHGQGPSFINEDLRFRQLVKHQRPSTEAVVFFCLDVSSSMTERDRKLAKSFFFWSLQGLRRQYRHIQSVFVAHTVKAWEFSEEDFFQVTAHGGTVASVAFSKVDEIIEERFNPDRYNIYLFYASDGENFPHDWDLAMRNLRRLVKKTNFVGYLETTPGRLMELETNTSRLFDHLAEKNLPVATFPLRVQEDVWDAIRSFFQHRTAAEVS